MPSSLCSQVSKNIGGNSTGGGATSCWIKIPDLFSRTTMHALATKVITKSARIEIVAAIAFHVYTHTQYPTSQEYTEVCEKLVQKYPVLKDTVGNGYVSTIITILAYTIYTFHSHT